jgi:hypothetical protein
MSNLTPQANAEHKVSSEDVFVDIARHGKSKSTQLLRTHGVDEQKVDLMVKQLGWLVLERK